MLSALTIVLAYVVLALPAAAIGIPWAMVTGNIGLLYRWSMWILRTGTKLARIRVQVEGRENIPARTCIFMANHVSNLDPPILYPELPFRTAFFLKRSLIKIPILGLGMRLANFVPVDRDGRLESARESVQAGSKVLASGVSISTFPEGTRSRSGCSGLNLGIGAHDDQRQPAHQARHRAPGLSPGARSQAIRHPGGAHGS